MKTLVFLVFGFLAFAATAQAHKRTTLKCVVVNRYVDRTSIMVDLVRGTYIVEVLDPLRHREKPVLGTGKAYPSLDRQGPYTTYTLADENGKFAGFLKAAEAGKAARIPSYFYYQGQTIGGELPAAPFICRYP